MARTQSVREADVWSMLRLMAELAELPPDPEVRSRHLLEGLCRLLGARAGTDVTSRRIRNGPKRYIARLSWPVFESPRGPPRGRGGLF